jgi:hypothetical protein
LHSVNIDDGSCTKVQNKEMQALPLEPAFYLAIFKQCNGAFVSQKEWFTNLFPVCWAPAHLLCAACSVSFFLAATMPLIFLPPLF